MASNAGAIKAGRAFVEIFADRNPLVRGLKLASKDIQDWGKSVGEAGKKVMAAGLAIGGPLLLASKMFASSGDSLAKASQRTGASVEALSELGFSAERSGSNMEDLEGSLRKMQNTLYDAATGGKESAQSLYLLNLRAKDLIGMAPDQQLEMIADRMTQIQDPAARAAIAMKVFGKSGAQLLPMLEGGARGIRELREQAKDLGLTTSTKDAKAAERLDDAMSTLWATIKGTANAVGGALAPVLTDVCERMASVVGQVNQWIQQNSAVVQAVGAVALGLIGAGAALIAFGIAIRIAGKGMAAVSTISTIIKAAFSPILAILGGLLTPIGLVSAAIVGMGVYILYSTGAAGKAIQWLGGVISGLVDDAKAAWGGIADALAQGDIALAARILWLTLKMEWDKGVYALQSVWQPIKAFFLKVWNGAVYGALAAWEYLTAGIRTAWVTLVAVLKTIWTGFTSWHQSTVTSLAGFFAKRMIEVQGFFDSSIDTKTAKEAVDQQVNAELDGIAARRKADQDATASEMDTKVDAIHKARDENLAGIGQAYEDESKAIDAAHQEKMTALGQELDAARKEWQQAIQTAHGNKAAADAAGPRTDYNGPNGADQMLMTPFVGGGMSAAYRSVQDNALKGMQGANDFVNRSSGVSSTFNADVAWGMGGHDKSAEIADATKKTAENTSEIKRNMNNGAGLKYGK